jgi:hypothetical protein
LQYRQRSCIEGDDNCLKGKDLSLEVIIRQLILEGQG